MPSGVVAKWVMDKGFGFIRPKNNGPDIFVHSSDLLGGEEYLVDGDEVSYRDAWDEQKDKARAGSVEVVRKASGRDRGRGRSRSPRGDSRGRDTRGGDRRGKLETGKLLRWNEQGGFGFIQPSDHGEDVFCHVSQVLDGDGSIMEGDIVTYRREMNERKGRMQAVDVQVTSSGGGGRRRSGGRGGGRSPPRSRSRRRGSGRDYDVGRDRDVGRERERGRSDRDLSERYSRDRRGGGGRARRDTDDDLYEGRSRGGDRRRQEGRRDEDEFGRRCDRRERRGDDDYYRGRR